MNIYKRTIDGWELVASTLAPWTATKLAASLEFQTKIAHRVAKSIPIEENL